MNEELEKSLTALLSELGRGSDEVWQSLLPAVYDQLKGVARKIAGPGADSATITPTALVHDAWAKLMSAGKFDFVDRHHFFAVAAVTMRRVLIDASRRRAAEKRGGDLRRVTLADVGSAASPVDLVELDEALVDLEQLSARQARVVELRFFAGLSVPEVADCLGLSVATIEADWRLARAWLGRRLS
ncbi:MAG: sigma-70 family RNA polymerase sigma factor [Planctomycetes bacterium]|nr:sigma-70 family RNA polymerase sigma factor [Planctomycetota bacterium]